MNITQRINKIAISTALCSLIIGTILFILQEYRFSKTIGLTYWQLMDLGVIYILIAAIVNSILLVVLIIHAIKTPEYYKENIISISSVLINIPIVFIFLQHI